jgi:hypothetical protein
LGLLGAAYPEPAQKTDQLVGNGAEFFFLSFQTRY